MTLDEAINQFEYYSKKVMKLEIVEFRMIDILNDTCNYRYVLELNERLLCFITAPRQQTPDRIYDILMYHFLESNIDYNLEHYTLYGPIQGIDYKVIFEQEVSDTYLKDLYIERRMKAIEGDFK